MFIGDFMEQLTRSELRKTIMTILYQIDVYKNNKIDCFGGKNNEPY